MKSRRVGINLTETIIAVFLTSLGVLTVAALIQAGMVANRKAERAYLAAFLAEKHLERIRLRATTTPDFDDWTSVDGLAAPDPDYPQYTVQVDSEVVPIYSPSTSLEARIPLDTERRKLTASYRKVRVRVSWDPSQPQKECVELYTLVGAPADRELASVTLTPTGPIPASMAQNATVPFTAVGVDAAGQVIPDLFFGWSVNTKTSVGSLPNVTRDGSQGVFKHWYRQDVLTGLDVHGPPGECQVNVTGAYHTNVVKNSTQLLQLGP